MAQEQEPQFKLTRNYLAIAIRAVDTVLKGQDSIGAKTVRNTILTYLVDAYEKAPEEETPPKPIISRRNLWPWFAAGFASCAVVGSCTLLVAEGWSEYDYINKRILDADQTLTDASGFALHLPLPQVNVGYHVTSRIHTRFDPERLGFLSFYDPSSQAFEPSLISLNTRRFLNDWLVKFSIQPANGATDERFYPLYHKIMEPNQTLLATGVIQCDKMAGDQTQRSHFIDLILNGSTLEVRSAERVTS